MVLDLVLIATCKGWKIGIILLTICLALDLFLSVTPKGWKESIGFPDAELYAKFFEKKLKKKYLEVCLAVNRKFFFDYLKRKDF